MDRRHPLLEREPTFEERQRESKIQNRREFLKTIGIGAALGGAFSAGNAVGNKTGFELGQVEGRTAAIIEETKRIEEETKRIEEETKRIKEQKDKILADALAETNKLK